ncbi:hypothetical protein EOS_41530 [Caballeronia mineralivorans PML1(12)]|jgi:hypothetical protein|uniref:Uncharacterized protein n=1 Tax=Caballeronia mineralivorans PML1(12) TaxID=908627 RepID=A0A0J1CIF5_9BURK|nr:hypothetical protein EOS_41530 [Caballeronia mineralivorans PML1(12)]
MPSLPLTSAECIEAALQLNRSAPGDLISTGIACIFKFAVRTSIRLANKRHGIPAFVALSMNLGFVPMRPRCVRDLSD